MSLSLVSASASAVERALPHAQQRSPAHASPALNSSAGCPTAPTRLVPDAPLASASDPLTPFPPPPQERWRNLDLRCVGMDLHDALMHRLALRAGGGNALTSVNIEDCNRITLGAFQQARRPHRTAPHHTARAYSPSALARATYPRPPSRLQPFPEKSVCSLPAHHPCPCDSLPCLFPLSADAQLLRDHAATLRFVACSSSCPASHGRWDWAVRIFRAPLLFESPLLTLSRISFSPGCRPVQS